MHSFTDKNGKAWSVVVNVGSIKRVRGVLGIDLMKVIEGKLLDQLQDDPVLLVDTLYVLCKPEAEASKITDEQFGAALGGDVLDAAVAALLEELADFFPGPKRRLLVTALKKYEALRGRMLKLAETRLNDPSLLDGIEAKFLAEMNRQDATPGAPSGSVPESSGSTPADSPSAN